MDMDHSPRVLDKLLEQCVEVSVERKSEILCEWAGKRMCHGLPLESCASCGIRDPDRDYHVVRLKELPSVFRLDKDACARRARLGSVDMYNQITEMWEPELAAAYAAERVASRRAAEAKGRKRKRPAGA